MTTAINQIHCAHTARSDRIETPKLHLSNAKEIGCTERLPCVHHSSEFIDSFVLVLHLNFVHPVIVTGSVTQPIYRLPKSKYRVRIPCCIVQRACRLHTAGILPRPMWRFHPPVTQHPQHSSRTGANARRHAGKGQDVLIHTSATIQIRISHLPSMPL